MTPNPRLFAVLALSLAAVSCTHLKPTQARVWERNHQTFRADPKWKGKAFVNEEVEALLTPETVSIKISLAEQRGLLLYQGEHVAIDFPVSTGRKAFATKPGDYNVIDKQLDHRSNLYGNYLDATTNKVIQADVDTTQDKKPEGAIFEGSHMPYFMRLTGAGLGMHIGKVPGYPASHGCIRVPGGIMPRIYKHSPMRTAVTVMPESFGFPEPPPELKAKVEAQLKAEQQKKEVASTR